MEEKQEDRKTGLEVRSEKIITIDSDLHRALKVLAAKRGKTLRELAETAINRFLGREGGSDETWKE